MCRLLEFRRVPPVAGRYINLTSDIEQLVDFDVGNTFFESPGKWQSPVTRSSYNIHKIPE